MATPFLVLSPIHQANRQASLYIDQLLADLGVSAAEGQLLAFVARRDGTPVSAVVRLLGVPKSTMTSIINRLVRQRLLRRTTNPADGRSGMLTATAEGVALGAAAIKRVTEFERALEARISDRDLRALSRIVHAITEITAIDLPAEAPQRRSDDL